MLVGYYDFHEPAPLGYKSYLNAAIKSLALDPWRRVQFAIVTGRKAAAKIRITKPSSLTLFQWNITYELLPTPGTAPKTEAILRWAYQPTDGGSLVDWITPSGIKSNALELAVGRTPSTFILFTPRSLILGISPYFDVVSMTDHLLPPDCNTLYHAT